jgi:hypothetical protein
MRPPLGAELIRRLIQVLARELLVLLNASGELHSDHGLWGKKNSSPLGGEVPPAGRGRGTW